MGFLCSLFCLDTYIKQIRMFLDSFSGRAGSLALGWPLHGRRCLPLLVVTADGPEIGIQRALEMLGPLGPSSPAQSPPF
jgi:hypothetical protein